MVIIVKSSIAYPALGSYTEFNMNSYAIVLVFVLIIIAAGMSFQYLKGIGKSFQSSENVSAINSGTLKQQQKQQAQDAEEQRRAYMENVKQRLRDSQRR